MPQNNIYELIECAFKERFPGVTIEKLELKESIDDFTRKYELIVVFDITNETSQNISDMNSFYMTKFNCTFTHRDNSNKVNLCFGNFTQDLFDFLGGEISRLKPDECWDMLLEESKPMISPSALIGKNFRVENCRVKVKVPSSSDEFVLEIIENGSLIFEATLEKSRLSFIDQGCSHCCGIDLFHALLIENLISDLNNEIDKINSAFILWRWLVAIFRHKNRKEAKLRSLNTLLYPPSFDENSKFGEDKKSISVRIIEEERKNPGLMAGFFCSRTRKTLGFIKIDENKRLVQRLDLKLKSK